MIRWLLAAALLGAVLLRSAVSNAAPCAGDCNDDAAVTVDEIISAVNIALDNATVSSCFPADVSGDGVVTVDELVTAVGNALNSCPLTDTPTPSPTEPPVAEPSMTPTATPTFTATPTPNVALSTATPTPNDVPAIPTTSNALLAWLEAGNYLDWPAESAPHPSTGPHFGVVRTFLNPTVFNSLATGSAAHPSGAALVKELYGSGSTVQGWSVMVKVQDNSAGGAGWYWYERFGGSTFAAATGVALCSGCHSLGTDYVRTPFPLQ